MSMTWEEKLSYRIAISAATGAAFSQDQEVCHVCKGTGLLPHPTSHMHVAVCYMCSHGLVAKKEVAKPMKKQRYDSCSAAIPIRS